MKRATIQIILNSTNDVRGKRFAIILQSLIVISLITFSISTLPDLSPTTRYLLEVIESVFVAIFTLEYILRIVVTNNKIGYIFSFYGIIDLLSILPSYISFGTIDLNTIRVVRLFRLIRIFNLLKYNKAFYRVRRSLHIAKEELVLFGFSSVVMIYFSAVGIYFFEHSVQPEQFKSIFHCLWWALITLTTVGYGDMYPITAGGKIFTSIILLIGLGIVAVPTALIASALSKARAEERVEELENDK